MNFMKKKLIKSIIKIKIMKDRNGGMLMNNLLTIDINLIMEKEKQKILKELVLKYLIKQITSENHG